MKNEWAGRCGGISLLLCIVSGCSGGGGNRHELGNTAIPQSTEATPETFEQNGRLFVRRDLWSDEDYERILHDGRADQDATTPEVLAAQLRAHVHWQGQYYIEAAPNLEMARRILGGETTGGTPARAPAEARRIFNPDRRAVQSAGGYPGRATGMISSGCSGAKIGGRTVYTAAHCYYETFAATNGWKCAEGKIGAPCAKGWPTIRFGVNGMSGYTQWTASGCDRVSINTAFISLTSTSDDYLFATADYAAVDLSACTANTTATGWYGAWIENDSFFATGLFSKYGYPVRAKCPDDSDGEIGFTGNFTNVLGTSCPGTGAWPGSTWQMPGVMSNQPPATSGVLFGSSLPVNETFPGDRQPGDTIESYIDTTDGDSGAALFTSSDFLVVGVLNGTNSRSGRTYNLFNRWNSARVNFFASTTAYPTDTQ